MGSAARTVAVTGATGFVGRHLVRALLGRGHRVVALTRDGAKGAGALPREAIDSGRVRLVAGDALGDGVLDALVEDADACCHLIGIIREAGGRQTFERVHARTTERVVRACLARGRAKGAPFRYVHMSALGVGGESPVAYRRTKFEGEAAVRASGLDWTILRPGLIHGPDGEFMRTAKSWAQGRALPYAFIPAFTRARSGGRRLGPVPIEWETPTVAPVHVDDVCAAFCEALDRPETIGEVYHLAGPERVTMRGLLERVRDAVPLGKRGLRVLGIPGALAARKARAARLVGMGRLLPFDEGMALMAIEDSVAPADKARAHLGFEPRAFTPSLSAYAPSM